MNQNSIQYCSLMQGLILDKLLPKGISKKVTLFKILKPNGIYDGNFMDRVSMYDKDELEKLLGDKYKTGDATELADILIYKLLQ